eukprot:4571883-Pyramimonas_sp.AAC.1
MGSSTEGPSGDVRWAAPLHLGTPLTRFVDPCGAPPKAPMAAPACVPAPLRHTLYTLRGPIKRSTDGETHRGEIHNCI